MSVDVTQVLNELKEIKDGIGGQVNQRVADEIETVKNEFTVLLKERDEEMKQLGEARDSTVTKLEEKDAELKKFAEELAEMKGQVDVLDKLGGRMGVGGEAEDSIGETFTKSDAFSSMLKRNANESDPVEVDSPFMRKAEGLTSITSGYGNAGTLITPQQLNELIRKPQPALRIRDFMRIFPTVSSTVEWVEMVGFKNLYTELTANALSTATSLTVKDTGGFYVGQKIDVAGTSATVQSVDSATGITLTAAIGAAKTSGQAVVSDELGFTPHGGLKPQANIQFAEKSEPVGTIAHWIPAHKQTLADAAQIQGIINTEMVAGLDLALDKQILRGPGGAPNLTGILNNANIQNAGTQPGTAANGVDMLDFLRHMVTLANLAEYPPDALCVYPLDWEYIETAKGTDDHYVDTVSTDGRETRVWRTAVIETTAMNPKQVLLGSFGLGAYLLDREQASIQVSDSHSDFFIRNMVAILAEARVGMAVPRPESFVKGLFA